MERQHFANSGKWQALFTYQDKLFGGVKSKVYHQEFFISKEGKTNPLAELNAFIAALATSSPNQGYGLFQLPAACAFPARYQLLQNEWPNIFLPVNCPEFGKWRENLSLGDVYLVYSSSYPQNPASLFGHTFLRFDRNRKDLDQTGQELLGYSVGFMAVTDPRDNPALYTFKGITGQYLGSFQVRPHYVNIGIYNNGESRDLWEYKLSLSREQKILLEKILYEQVLGPGYPYYFFDDNCSYYLLQLLEMVDPTKEYFSKERFVVLPHETLQDVVKVNHLALSYYRPSLSKIIREQVNNFNAEQRREYQVGMDPNAAEIASDDRVLDALIDSWNELTYKKKANLLPAETTRRHQIFSERSKRHISLSKNHISNELKVANQHYAPHLAHASHRVSLGGNRRNQIMELGYGLHRRQDSLLGFDPLSFIDYLSFEFERNDASNYSWRRFKFIEIEALDDTSWIRPKLSWKIYSDFTNVDDHINPVISGGMGFSKIFDTHIISLFTSVQEEYHGEFRRWSHQFTLSPQLTLRKEKWTFDFIWKYGLEGGGERNNRFVPYHLEKASLHFYFIKNHALIYSVERSSRIAMNHFFRYEWRF